MEERLAGMGARCGRGAALVRRVRWRGGTTQRGRGAMDAIDG